MGGGVCPAPDDSSDETLVSPDGDAVFGNRQHDPANTKIVTRNEPTSWHLWWTAPPAGSGAVTIYVAAVDGNGGNGSADNDQDPSGDDTVQASFSCPRPARASSPARSPAARRRAAARPAMLGL